MADESKLKAQARELALNLAPNWAEIDQCFSLESFTHQLTTFADEQVKAETADLREKLFVAEQVLKMIWHRGHNSDCLFCGLKDREVKAYADKYLPDFNSELQEVK